MSEFSAAGIPCPACGNDSSRVTDSRVSEKNKARRRRRICETCQHHFTTYEVTSDRMNAMLTIETSLKTMHKTMKTTIEEIEGLIQ